jgi:hypothetical protein
MRIMTAPRIRDERASSFAIVLLFALSLEVPPISHVTKALACSRANGRCGCVLEKYITTVLQSPL